MFQRFSVLIGLTIISLVLTSCKKDEPAPLILPEAEFGFTGGNCVAPCEVEFTNASSNAEDYLWDFGDGGISTEKNPKHKFASSGTFNVSLRAKNVKNGLTDTQIKAVSISALPTKMTISKIVIQKWPLKDANGNYFDSANDPPDLYLFMLVSGSAFYDAYSKNTIVYNPVEGQSYEIIIDKSMSASSTLETSLYDLDVSSGITLMSSPINLTPSEFIKGKLPPSTIVISNATIQMTLYVTWQF
jgi:PKD repeat protein